MHTLDMILAEGLIILQWFNPLAWIFKRMLVENHEFLADKAVLNRGFSPESYQLRIIAQLFGVRSMPTAHYFNQTMTEKRLKMMKKPKSTLGGGLKVLLALPFAIGLFYLFACSKIEAVTTDMSQDKFKAENVILNKEGDTETLIYLAPEGRAEPDGGS